MNFITKTILVFAVVVSTGCSINHPIAEDYNQYLVNNQGKSNLPKSDVSADYLLTEATINHRYEFRAALVGYGHLWIVEFGKILNETLQSEDVQIAFGELKESQGEEKGSLLTFELENYEFKDLHAHISLNITLTKNGEIQFEKSYQAEGASQGGKMFWGGPFAMKNSTQQSTKVAIDQILSELIQDINKVK